MACRPNLDNPEVFDPTPWEAYTYDANDNAGRTHHDESLRLSAPLEHAGQHCDRCAGTHRSRRSRATATRRKTQPTHCHRSRSFVRDPTYDIRGNLLTVTDALGREAFNYVYDFANRPLRIDSIDAGVRRAVLDATGNEIERRDSKGALILQAYDDLNRLNRLWARDEANCRRHPARANRIRRRRSVPIRTSSAQASGRPTG